MWKSISKVRGKEMKKYKAEILLGSLVLLVIIFLIVVPPKISAYQKEAGKANFYQSGIELMKQGNWSEARNIFLDADKYYPNTNSPYYNNQEKRYEEGKILIVYSYARINYDTDRLRSWETVDNSLNETKTKDYSGAFADDIKKFRELLESDPIVQKKKEEDKIKALTESLLSKNVNGLAPPKEPRIGMTSSEVRSSTWGKPTKVNKTTTASSVSEQWVYSSSKYVYLKDGIVTAIQE